MNFKGFFKKISLQVKVVFGLLAGIAGFILFSFVRDKILAREKMHYELERVKSEMKIANLGKDSSEKLKRIEDLKNEETLIREKIKFIEEREAVSPKKVSTEELESFFSDRGL